MKTILKIAVATSVALGASASAGAAANGAAATGAAVEGSGAQSAPTAQRGGAAARKYCLTIEPITGTRITRRECLTRGQWEDRGFDLRDAR